MLCAERVDAASATWNGTTDGVWATTTNWSATPVPGTTDTATFDNAGNSNTTISLGTGVTIRNITFTSNAAAAYTIGSGAVGSQTLNFEAAGTISVASTVTNPQTFNSAISLPTIAGGTYTISNNSASNLTFAGTIASGTGGTAAAKTLAVNGTGNVFFNSINRGGATSLTLNKTAAGTITLGGSADNGSLAVTTNGGLVILNKASTSAIHAINASSTVTSGTLRLSGTGGDQIVNSATMTVNGGVFDLNGLSETINGLAGTGGTIYNTVNASTSTLTVGSSNANTSYAGIIADNNGGGATGKLAFTKIGTGTQTLTGVNTYTGGTTVSAGLLSIGAASNLGADVAGNNIIVNAGGNLTIAAAANFGSNQTLTINSSATALGGYGLGFIPATQAAIPAFTNTRTGTTTGGVFGVNVAAFNTALDMSTLGTGGMLLGSQTAGTYTAATLGVDGTTYRLGGGGGTLTLANAVLIGVNDVIVGDTRTNGGGTVVLGADNVYTGTTTVNAGILQIGNGGTVGAWGSGALTVNAGGTLAYNRTDTLNLPSTTVINGGLTLATGTVAATNNTQLAAAGLLTFGNSNGAATTASLDLNSFSATFSSGLVRTNNSTANTVTIGAGQALTINGAGGFTMGYDAGTGSGATLSRLTVSGLGSMSINNASATINIGTNQAAVNASYFNDSTLDVSGLASFSTNVATFNIGVGGTTQGPGTVLLSNTTNSIITTTLTVGNTGTNNGQGTGLLVFGTGTNTIQADTINIGLGKGSGPGVVRFASQTAGSPGTVAITNKAGSGRATIAVGFGNGVGTAGGAVGTLDLRGHSASVMASTVTVGNANGTSNVSGVTGTLSFDTGTFDVNTLNIAPKSAASTGIATGTVNIGGGNFIVNTAFTLGSQASAGSSVATLNLTGGTLNSNADILKGPGTTTATFTLDGGTLELNNKTLGSSVLIDTLNLRSGTMQNVAQINNGAAITKTTAGMLVLAGNNAYTGATNVAAGTLRVNGKIASAVNVIAGTLDGTGNGTTTGLIAAAVLIGDGTGTADSILAPGNSIGTLTATGALTFNTDGAFNVEIDTTSGLADKMVANGVTIGAGVNINFAELNPGVLGAGSFTLIDNTSASLFSAPFANLAEGGTVTLGANSFTATYLGGVGGNDLVLNVVAIPEPSTIVLGGIALLGLAAYRRRRQSLQTV